MESWVLESDPSWSTIRPRLRSDHRKPLPRSPDGGSSKPANTAMHARLTVNRWISSPAAAGPSQAWRLADRAGVRRRLLTGHKSPAHHGPTLPTKWPPHRPHFTAATPHWSGESLGSWAWVSISNSRPPVARASGACAWRSSLAAAVTRRWSAVTGLHLGAVVSPTRTVRASVAVPRDHSLPKPGAQGTVHSLGDCIHPF